MEGILQERNRKVRGLGGGRGGEGEGWGRGRCSEEWRDGIKMREEMTR